MKKIVWDWNGTLFDDVNLCHECVNYVLEKHGNQKLDTLQDYRNVFGFPIIDYYRKAGFNFEVTPFDLLANEYMNYYTPKSFHCSLQKDTLKALRYVIEQKDSQIILSASKIENLEDQLSCFDLNPYIESVWGITDIYANSKEAIAHEFMKTCSDEVWFIGDSIHDYEVAQSVHANCILLTCGHQSRKRLEACGVPVLDSPLEGVKYIYERNEYKSE